MKNLFKKKEKASQFPTEVVYKYTLRINYKKDVFPNNWECKFDEEIKDDIATPFKDVIDWYMMKPNLRYYKLEARTSTTILDRENIVGMSVSEKIVIVE